MLTMLMLTLSPVLSMSLAQSLPAAHGDPIPSPPPR